MLVKAEGAASLFDPAPPDNILHIDCFPGVSVISTKAFAAGRPSRIPQHFIENAKYQNVTLLAMYSTVDWFAYADGKWQITSCPDLSLSADGIHEDLGMALSFEEPFWAGKHLANVVEDETSFSFPFYPLKLAETGMFEFFGCQIKGDSRKALFIPEFIPLMRLK